MSPPDAPPPAADEVQRVYPDLATLVIATTPSIEGARTCGLDYATSALEALGHSRAAVEAAIGEGCAANTIVRIPAPADLPTGDSLTISEEMLATWKSLALALSGGGLRATLFELGILLYLSLVDELTNVRLVVSVSGGSILSAHLALRWQDAIRDLDGFLSVAADIVKFSQTNIRDSAFIPFIWTRLCVWSIFSTKYSRTAFLGRVYKRQFFGRTLDEMLPNHPQFAFVATDSIKQQRVALMPNGILRFGFDGQKVGEPVLADGVFVSLAVTASSCFPPVFGRMHLTYKHLGIPFDAFKESLRLNDGGVSGNLGVEVLANLLQDATRSVTTVLVCDAECGLADEPANNPLADIRAQGDALSQAARERTGRDFGPNAKLLRFAQRTPGTRGLSARVQTALRRYRTDLDKPGWQECYALMIHGAAICEAALASRGLKQCPTKESIRARIREVLVGAGARQDLHEPNELDLRGCGKQPLRRVLWHAAAALFVATLTIASVCEATDRVDPGLAFRPLSFVWHLVRPEPIADLKIDDIADNVATAVCTDTLAAVEKRYIDGTLIRLRITVGVNASDNVVYAVQKVQPAGCDHEIQCKVTFRGKFGHGQIHTGDTTMVVGRIVRISTTSERLSVFVECGDCYTELSGTRRGT